MNKTSWIVLAAMLIVVVGGTAGVVAVALFSGVDGPPETTTIEHDADDLPGSFDPGERTPDLIEAPPTLRGAETPTDANLSRRLGALEDEVKSLREQLAAERKLTQPLRDMVDQAKEGGMLVGPGQPLGSGEVIGDGLPGSPAYAAKLAKDLGLDAGRAKAFKTSYESFLEKAKALEKENATVARDGDTTTITIKPFGQAGEQLRREWDDYVDSTLTADEKQGYDKRGARNQLIGNRGGDWTRTVKIKEAGGTISVGDSADDGKGGKTQQVMEGPAMAREVILSDYAHLLK